MSASGHIMDMMNRIRQNAALRDSRRNKFKGGNKYSNASNSKTEYDFPKVTSSELEIIKNKIRKEAGRENKKQRIFWTLFAIAVTIVFLFFIYY